MARPSPSTIKLGTLVVGDKIGEGGFGRVHEARIKGINFPFAVKLLDPSIFNDGAVARDRFFREAELLFKLRHQNITSIYGVGEHERFPYILMERFGGINLNEATKHPLKTPETLLPFIQRVAEGLHHAHQKGVVHRDIKPANLMTAPGDARVLDFGIAAIVDPEGTRLTRTGGTFVGDSFAAPELIQDPKLIDPRCDVYSLGACWFWLLTGRAPKGLSFEAELRSRVKISPDYESVVLRCLEREDKRYQSMFELLDDLFLLRAGARPSVVSMAASEADARVLGVIAAACSGHRESLTFYELEQQLAGSLARISLVIATRKLEKLRYVESFYQPARSFNDDEELALRVTSDGFEFIEKNQAWIEKLVAKSQPSPAPQADLEDDDIPF